MLREQDRQETRGSQVVRYSWRLLPKERGGPACLSYIVEGDRIRLPGKPGGVRFDFPIGDVIETEEAIVICLDVPEGRKCSENVYAVDRDGNLLWRVWPRAQHSTHGAYVALSVQGSVVQLHARDGETYHVNSRNGSPIRTEDEAESGK
jgi:hypothetical protein